MPDPPASAKPLSDQSGMPDLNLLPTRCPVCGPNNNVKRQQHSLHPLQPEFDYFECFCCGHAWRGPQ